MDFKADLNILISLIKDDRNQDENKKGISQAGQKVSSGWCGRKSEVYL